MRAFCTVSAPLEVCASSAEQLSPGSRFLALRLLGTHQPKTLYFLVDAKSRVREVYTQTCLHFATQGMLDTELFGLAVLIDGEYMFADPESKLSKYGPKSWRSSHTHGLDANGRPLLELHFRVQFYIESPFMLKDETSRHNYYLQLKYNALQRDIPKEYSDQSMLLLAGLALQADLGDAPTIITTTPSSTSSNSSINNNTTTTNGNATTIASNVKVENNSSHDVSTTTPTTTAPTTTTPASTSASSVTATKTNSILPITVAETIATTSIMTSTTTTTTTTLPKINRRINSNTNTSSSSNEKLLRLSTTFVKPTAAAATTTTANSQHMATTLTTLTSTSTSSSTSKSTSAGAVFPISGNLKRSLNAVAATLSPLSSTMSINRNISMTTSTSTPPHPSSTQIDYFRLEDYLPIGLRNTWAASALRACHRENHGMSAADAELHYIRQACLVHESINAHTFRMRMAKSEQGPGNSWFVVYAKGIKIYGISDASASQQVTFLWPNITKLSFERKKFEIRSGDSKITLYATSDEKNKMLLTLCKETHQFSMKMAARLKEVIKREEEENNCLHACYIYSRSLHLPYKNKNDQRISVISSTSSNTTSGIVSDRVHSEDELEIMINTPPAPIAAPSTESLALAHLLDRPSVSRQTSSVGQVSLKELEDQLVALSVRQQQQQQQQQRESPTELSNTSAGNSSTSSSFPTSVPRHNTDSSTATDSPNSQHNIGSQCSSTCSTVVVALPTDCSSTGNPLASLAVHPSLGSSGGDDNASPITNGNRRNSTSSSLELGFSHTAQNSTLSEAESTCHEHDFISTPIRLADETESVSGVYTLAHGAPPTETSGVYTMHSSEMTGQSSEIAESESQASSHYGIFQPSKVVINDTSRSINLDAVDGSNNANGNSSLYCGKRIKNEEFRLRSDSNVSTSGSFRGDGSDPTDKKHTLLSAEELTELIVGRGTYPNRKTVSSTLDSDCDYVTLPLTMAGDSYIQGHQDTAPSEEDHAVDDLMDVILPTDPPAPPQRIDSNASNLSNIRVRSPPPYNARHEKTGLCGPPVRISNQLNKVVQMPVTSMSNVSNVPSSGKAVSIEKTSTTSGNKTTVPLPSPISSAAIQRRDPPPYPKSVKPRPTSLVSVSSTASSSPLRHAASIAAKAPQPQNSYSNSPVSSLKSEEITARFITTRPQINILKAHTTVVNENPKPCYAAPTHCSSLGAASSTGSVASTYLAHNSNYSSSPIHPLRSFNVPSHHHHHPPPPPVPASSSQLSAAAAAHVAAAAATGAGVIPSTIGIPIVPYSLHAAHKSMSSLHQQPPPPPPPYPDMKPSPRTCVLLPVIKPRQYLPPPPPSLPRQPPPPPPPQLATMYSGQLARKQLELYQQQLYSDVDYVIYPIQDPAVSQQEYLDAKQSSLLAAMAQSPPPHPYYAYHHHHHHPGTHAGAWDTCKAHAIYRSTPYLPIALSTHSRYASTQNLSDTYVQLPGAYSPLYSPSVASLCSSYEPPPPLHPSALAAVTTTASTSNLFARSRSDDNILNSIDSLPKVKRLPPPPPPPYVNRRLKKPPMPAPGEKPPPIPSKPTSNSTSSSSFSNFNARSQLSSHKIPTLRTHGSKSHMTKTSSGAQWAGERPKPDSALSHGISSGSSSILSHLQASVAAANKAAQNAAATASKSSPTITGKTALTTLSSTTAAGTATPNDIDIALLREKSKILDLPLITALCNDRSLLKQTKAFVPPKNSRNSSSNASATAATTNATAAVTASAVATTSTTATAATSVGNHITSKSVTIGNNSSSLTTSINGQCTTPVVTSQQLNSATIATTLATTTSNKLTASTNLTKPRKTSISHRHPNDKLPPLPMQLAEANNYVMDPALLKHHKSYNSQT